MGFTGAKDRGVWGSKVVPIPWGYIHTQQMFI
jgi:hypothetical protein